MEVTVFSTPSCPWCHKAKEFLDEKGVKYKEVNVAEDEAARNEMIEKSGQMGVPVLLVKKGDDEKVIVGFDQAELEKAIAE